MYQNNKTYLYATMYGNKLKFRSHDGDIYGFWAGGSPDEPKFIIEKLVEMYGVEEGYDVYKKFTEALLEVSKMGKFNKPTACITLYEKKDRDK